MTEKTIGQEDLMGLEKEIDAAVDRLFVEKVGKPLKSASEVEPLLEMFPSYASPPVESLETQLLSLEWEITKENLDKTVQEVFALKKEFKGDQDISLVLNRMANVLNFMIQNQEEIRPHLVQFLLDSKETVKLLTRKGTEDDIAIYKKLAYAGIEARFSCLEELHEAKPKPSPVKIEVPEKRAEAPPMSPALSEEIIMKMESFSEKMDKMIETMNQHLAAHERLTESLGAGPVNASPLKTKVTVFKTGERLFGVESDKVIKLFKVPTPLRRKMIQLRKVRLKGLEVRMIDLENLFSITGEDREGERQVLVLKGDGEYKGLMMDQVLNRLSGPLEQGGGCPEYLLGMIRWTYQDLPIKVPILDFEKL